MSGEKHAVCVCRGHFDANVGLVTADSDDILSCPAFFVSAQPVNQFCTIAFTTS